MQPLVPLVFHNLPSLYPPSFRRNDFFIGQAERAHLVVDLLARFFGIYMYKKSFLLNEGGYRDGKL